MGEPYLEYYAQNEKALEKRKNSQREEKRREEEKREIEEKRREEALREKVEKKKEERMKRKEERMKRRLNKDKKKEEKMKRKEERKKRAEEALRREMKRLEEKKRLEENLKEEYRKNLEDYIICLRSDMNELGDYIDIVRRYRECHAENLAKLYLDEERLNELVNLQNIAVQKKRREVGKLTCNAPEIHVLREELKGLEEILNKMYEDITLKRKEIANETELICRNDRLETNVLIRMARSECKLERANDKLEKHLKEEYPFIF